MSMLTSIIQALSAKKRLVLISVIKRPLVAKGQECARMLAGEEGCLYGSIGGSLLERQALEKAKEVLASESCQFLDVSLACELSSADAGNDGGIRLFLEPLLPDGRTTTLFERLKVAERMADDMFAIVPVTAPGQRRVCRLHAEKWPLPVSVTQKVREALADKALTAPIELNMGLGQHFIIEPWLASPADGRA